jgi:hypothetical protein
MANEYLRRTPTSTSNRRVWTWSVWVKRNILGTAQNLLCSTEPGLISKLFFNTNDKLDYQNNSPSFELITSQTFRDTGNWTHILFVAETTASISSERIRLYVNGVRITKFDTETYPTINSTLIFNYPIAHFISNESSNVNYFTGEFADIFFIDGQALTPDVFGFYKVGKGYVSAGSTQSTDFRPGQWVPKTPRVIKTAINNNGGFGVNGFYLPMNDSSNFGADFHTTPNSIITLKGEDLPQPRNGAPETADAYVSQLRSDPFAANLVLAVPGASTATGSTLITNGTFDTDLTGWTNGNPSQFTYSYNSVGGNTGGKVMYYAIDNNTRTFTQFVTCTSGQRYTLSFDACSDTANAMVIDIDGTNVVTIDDNNNINYIHYNVSFTAGSGSVRIRIESAAANRSYFDNFVVKQEDAPKDYSADIKGSGTNKTLTANGNAGVGYEIPSYYGSALSFDGSGDYFSIPDTEDFEFGTGDYTVEFWVNCQRATSGTTYYEEIVTKGYPFQIYRNNTGLIQLSIDSNTGGGYDFTGSFGTPGVGNWAHVAVSKNNGVTTLYMNGVARGIQTTNTNINNTGSNFTIGEYADAAIYPFNGYIQDVRVYKGVAKYTGGFDVPKPYTPVNIATWRAVPDTTANNFATLNGVVKPSKYTVSNGNLTFTNSTTNWTGWLEGTVGFSTGKFYWETRIDVSTDYHHIGIVGVGITHFNSTDSYFYGVSYQTDGRFWAERNTGTQFQNGVTQSKTVGDIVQVAVDMPNKRMWIGKNGTWFSGDPSNGSSPPFDSTVGFNYTHYVPFYDSYGSSGLSINFGQNPTFSGNTTAGTFTDSNSKGLFKYEPPSGFLALCEDNLPTPAISDPGKHFKTVLYTGDSNAGRSIVGVGFTPDLVWIKSRNVSGYNQLMDSVRGAGIQLYSNDTLAEAQGNYLTSFDNDGFSINYNSSGATNASGTTYTAWCWKAGAGTTSTNTNGSITSVVSVNQDAGFSIVSYTGNGTAGATIGHGLGKAPKFILIKRRSGASNWAVAGSILGSASTLYLNLTNPLETYDIPLIGNIQTSTTFQVGTDTNRNASGGTHIAYCWAEIEGFSKFGSYVGNGSADGPFVYCGFKPALVLIKTTSGGSWVIKDSSRSPNNPNGSQLYANTSAIDDDPYGITDFLSNGFKPRVISQSVNASGETYIFAAFAESAFSYSNAK